MVAYFQLQKFKPVISITHLEPYPSGQDLFNRPTLDKPGPVKVEGQEEYEIKQIVAKCTHKTKSGRTKTQYLVKWLGYNGHKNTWLDDKDLRHAQDLLKEFEHCRRAQPIVIPNKSYSLMFSYILYGHVYILCSVIYCYVPLSIH